MQHSSPDAKSLPVASRVKLTKPPDIMSSMKTVKPRRYRQRTVVQSTGVDAVDDGFDVKELMALAEPIPVSPPRRMLTLDSAGDALRRTGYDLVNRIEQRGDRNLVCAFTLRGRTAPAFDRIEQAGRHLRQLLEREGFDVPVDYFLASTDGVFGISCLVLRSRLILQPGAANPQV